MSSFVAMVRYFDKVYFSSQFKGQSIMAGKPKRWELEAAVTVCPLPGSKIGMAVCGLAMLLRLHSLGSPAHPQLRAKSS